MLDVGVKIAGALQTAHDRGLLHRDIKPQNLFVSEFGEPALGDFGISTLDDERSISGGGGLTVHYAPPEVLEGAPATPISDVYSFAATLYTLLEGRARSPRPAAARQSVGELARRIMLEEPPRARRADVPRSLADLLARTMAKRPEERPASAAELGQELQRVQGELGLPVTALPLATPLPPRPRPRRRRARAGAVVRRRRRSAAGAAAAAAPARSTPPASSCASSATSPTTTTHGHTVTVGRAVPAADRADGDGDRTSTRRVVLGTVAAVVCLLAVAVSLLLFGRGGDDDDDDDRRPAPTTTQLLQSGRRRRRASPSLPAAEPGPVVVAWQAVGEPATGCATRSARRPPTLQPQNTDRADAHVRRHRRRRPALLHRRRHHRRRPHLRPQRTSPASEPQSECLRRTEYVCRRLGRHDEARPGQAGRA